MIYLRLEIRKEIKNDQLKECEPNVTTYGYHTEIQKNKKQKT